MDDWAHASATEGAAAGLGPAPSLDAPEEGVSGATGAAEVPVDDWAHASGEGATAGLEPDPSSNAPDEVASGDEGAAEALVDDAVDVSAAEGATADPGPAPASDASGEDVSGVEGAVVDARSEFGTMPIPTVGGTPPLGTEAVQEEWGGRELVEGVYGPLSEFYEALDARLREVPEDVPPVGWAPHIAALRALREERVTGDWEVLARFLAAPGSLDESEHLRLVQTGDVDDVVRETVKEVAAADGRALLIAPTPERAADLLRTLEDDPEVFSLMIETQPATAESPSVETQALPPVTDEVAEPEPVREFGANGTVEFKPLVGQPTDDVDDTPAVTRVEPLPAMPMAEPAVPEEGPSAPETRVRSAALRPIGEAWRLSWETETRLLRRGLMWLEQWPRDAATLRAVEAENLRRREALAAERTALAATIEESRNAATAAENAAVEAETEAERLAAVQTEAETELEGPRAEAERLRAIAEEAAAEANALTRTADAAYARCVQLDERARTAQTELQEARQTEASLKDELTRAQEALPAAAEEAHRLAAADADAAAEGHAAYYRLVSAESALSALRRKMTLGQRLHVASPPSELRSLRAEVKARTREADEAAKQAREAKDAAEHAERVRRGLASFVSEGGARLQQAQEAQRRLGTELTWLATERETATAEHQKQARLASTAVEKATQEATQARLAQQTAQAIEDRINAARTSREAALSTARQARSDAEAATARAAETAVALERHDAAATEALSAMEDDLETARRTEARSRENVLEICGTDPTTAPEAVADHQRRAMARIEELTAYTAGKRSAGGDVLLRTADLVVGTPTGVGLTVRDEEFDTLIVADACAVTDAEFLIGAVRSRAWVLVSAPGSRPPDYREYVDAPTGRLEASPFERAATAAPSLLDVR
ncbi:hypothetical protein BZB76_0940 [Actinomadura pelletieri DSM 43383]|uniref:Uncharacterized protein n=1 Tax=Actinomadura pelletieri DSM 43383 TaxID=1120940 RepID=A0A495QZT9_9ACTN|nr:hypothetical protein BZB76_0940 [Actinomadura pelletieri DSM 43383]